MPTPCWFIDGDTEVFLHMRIRLFLSALLFTLLEAAAISPVLAKEVSPDDFIVRDDSTQLAQWFSVRESVELPYEYSLSAGVRRDTMSWSIANSGLNVASEVKWDKTVIQQIRFSGRANLGSAWYVRGLYDTGAIRSGSTQDSDYAGSDRTQLYSRSESQTTGAIGDVNVGIGKRLHIIEDADGGGLYIAPLLGLSIHQQRLAMHEGRQSVPFNAPLIGQSDSYDSQWKGYWTGVDLLAGLGGEFTLSVSAEYHWVDYTAEANWSLRNDLAHPLSFRHVAKGNGKLISAGLSYRFTRNLLCNLAYERQSWKTKPGYDETYFSYGGSSTYVLNPLLWSAEAVYLGFVYRF
jgi:hypothetical protein